MEASSRPIDLCATLQRVVIPQVLQSGVANLLMPPARWSAGMALAAGMTANQVALRGKPSKLRGSRPYGDTALFDAVWRTDRLHSSRMPTLCFVVKGPLVYQIADYQLHCDTGHAILIPPGIPYADGSHRFLDESKTRHGKCIRLQMQPYHGGLFCWRTHNWLDDAGNPQHNEQSYSLRDSRVPDVLYQLLDEMAERQVDWEIICNGLLRLLLGLLHRELLRSPSIASGKVLLEPASERPQHAIDKIEHYIHQNLPRQLSIEKLASRAAMSRTAFTVQFRARTGKSLVEYLTAVRLEKARELLADSDLAVEQVARAVGFAPDRLRVLFRQQEGMSPLQYCQQHRTNAAK